MKNANEPISIPDTQGSQKGYLLPSCIRLHQGKLVEDITKRGRE